MKYILLFCVCLVSVCVSAQKLYLNEIQNGNYKSFDLGDKIEFMITDSTQIYKGIITSIQNDGFVLNDTLFVKLSQIAAMVKSDGGGRYGIGRVLLIVLGSYMVLNGAIYVIGGLFLTAVSPPVGVIAMAFGAGLGIGGYAIINRQVKRAKNRTMQTKPIDHINYGLIIE